MYAYCFDLLMVASIFLFELGQILLWIFLLIRVLFTGITYSFDEALGCI